MKVVFLHGFLGTGEDWRQVIEALGLEKSFDQNDFWAPDLFNPQSSAPLTSFEDFCGWLEVEVKRRFNGEKVHLIGYSLGGRMALHSMKKAPHLWKKAVLISAHPGLKDPEVRKARGQFDHEWAHQFQTQTWTEVVQAWNSQPILSSSQAPVRNEENFSRQRLGEALVHLSPSRHTEFLESHGRAPIDFVGGAVGAEDPKYLKIYTALHEMGALDRLSVIPNAGHRLMRDQPEVFAKCLRLWLENDGIC